MEINDSGPRRAWLAVIFSLFCVGLGQVYCGRVARGVKLFLLSLVFVPGFLLAALLPPSTPVLILIFVVSVISWPVYLFSIVDAFRIARRHRDGIGLTPWNRPSVYALCVVLGLFAPSLGVEIVWRVGFDAYRIPTRSMAPCVDSGDRILVNQLTYVLRTPERWEVAAHRRPDDRTKVGVKRVVGLPGDRIESVHGRLILNGEPVPGDRGDLVANWAFVTTVPEGSYFLLGDNRGNSYDSRLYGPVPVADMLGPTQYVFWPPGRLRSLAAD